MIANKAGFKDYDQQLFETRKFNRLGALIEPLSHNQTYWVAVGTELEWVCISYRDEKQYSFMHMILHVAGDPIVASGVM